MGSGASRHLLLPPCLRPSGGGRGGGGFEPGQLDEALGHSFCYVRSSPRDAEFPRSPSTSAAETAFRAISGASVSANSSAPIPLFSDAEAAAPGFQSSASFSALPLQLSSSASGPLDRGFFLSGPLERGALSGPLDAAVPFSGPLAKKPRRKRGRSFSGGLRRASLLPRSLSERNRPWVVPLRGLPPAIRHVPDAAAAGRGGGGRVEWAHGKAGEDRSHVVVSEDHRWLFVGIYDGFNGPDAPEFLLSKLYRSVHHELRGLFWEELDEDQEQVEDDTRAFREEEDEEVEERKVTKRLWEFLAEGDDDEVTFSTSGRLAFSMSKLKHGLGSWRKDGGGRVWFPRWQYDAREKARIGQEVVSSGSKKRRRKKMGPVVDHGLVLGALTRALQATEAAYLEMTDRAMDCNPELALMGSCLLVVLMRDQDVYVMNVGDSRAIVAQYRPPQGMMDGDGGNAEGVEGEEALGGEMMELAALQLSIDHSTSIEEV